MTLSDKQTSPGTIEALPLSETDLRGMTLDAMTILAEDGGYRAYRARQLYEWIYRHGAESFDEMTNLPKEMRLWLERRVRIGVPRLVRAEGPEAGTRKVLFELADGRVIESVVMRDQGKGRTSLCISSQVGCAVGCTFCLTGYGGFQRHCTAGEIVSQILAIRRHVLAEDEPIHGVVFMGMGEPMLNLVPVVDALRLITDPDGVQISPRRITVSTAGVVPGIEAFGRADTGAKLAVSLNATTDAVRTAIMPLNKRWPIARLIEACDLFPLRPRRRITIEYVLMKGVNDSPADAERLAGMFQPHRYKINLIMFNPHELLDFEPADEATIDLFKRTLSDVHLTATVRWSKGREIEAACGQLAAHYFQNKSA